MKSKVAIIILLIICLGLGAALWYRHQQAVQKQSLAQDDIEKLQTDLRQAIAKLTEQRNVNATLETNRAFLQEELQAVSNKLQSVSTTLTETKAQAKKDAQKAQEEIAQRDQKINQLEKQNSQYSARMEELNSNISTLESQIAQTEQQLSAAEGDREFLLNELKRLQAEKAELERQFNDLAVLREQVRNLTEELTISRRLDWLKRGLFGSAGSASDLKGAERLQRGFSTPEPTTQQPDEDYGLEVELERSGDARIQSSQTNSPNENQE